MFGNSFVYANIGVSPESILKNEIGFFSINFFGDANANGGQNANSLIATMRNIVSQVYVTVRDICLVAMLIVMIYVAIRGLIALSPKEKSRYKENFVNCLVGIILIVSAHFIMSISVRLVDMIAESIATATDDVQVTGSGNAENMSEGELKGIAQQNSGSEGSVYGGAITVTGEKIYKALEEAGYPNVTLTSQPSWWQKVLDKLPFVNYGDEYVVTIQCSSFTEQARYMCQEIYDVNEDGERTNENWNYIGWALVYIMFVILTIAFTWLYGRRVFYMAALTAFAPIIGVMYPINRVNGSRAQTLNLWFKEYMGNLLMQPFHLFLYTIFVGSAMEAAINSPIFVIIALIGILVVEKLLKDMLGIQDTRIGGLGKAIQDTARAIKTAERTTASVAKGIGRTASRGAHGLIGAYENYRNGSEEGEEVETNTRPREQNMPIEQPTEVLSGEAEDNNAQLGTEVLRNRNAENPEVVMDVPYREVSSEPLEDPNSSEETVLPGNDPLRLEMKDEDVAAGAAALNAENDDTTIALNEQDDLIDDDDMSTQDLRELPGFLEPETLDMIDELNGNVKNIEFDTFNQPDILQEVGSSKPSLDAVSHEEFIKSDRGRNVYRNKDNGNLRIEPGNTPDFNPPMSVAMAAGSEARSINVGADRTRSFDNSLENTSREYLRGGNSSRTSQLGANASTTIPYSNSGNSQAIPDGNNVRIKIKNDTSSVNDQLNVWTNPNEPLPSSNEKPEMKVLDGGRGKNIEISNDVGTNNIDLQDVGRVANNDINDIPVLDEPNVTTTFDNTNNNIPEVNIPDSVTNANNASNNNIKMNNIPNNNDIPTVNIPASTTNVNNIPNDINTSYTGTSSNANTTSNNSGSENIHRLREDEYRELPPHEEAPKGGNSSTNSGATARGANNNTSNTGANNNTNNTSSNNNTSNAGANNNANNTPATNNTNNATNTQDGQGNNNQASNNDERETGQYEATTARRIVGGAEKVAGRTAGVVGTAVSGIIDTATTVLSGDIGGAVETGVNATMDSVSIATGSPSRSSRGSGAKSSSKKANQSSGNLTRDAETVMKNANVSEAEAIALAEACKALGINDDRNMVLIGKVYKDASSADKKKVVELSKMLHRMKENGKSRDEAEKALENESISTATKDLLVKMYKDLHI